MKTEYKEKLRKVMALAWQFVRRNGYELATALKTAWANVKLVERLRTGIVKFYFQKVDGSIREAFGTLKSSLLPPTLGERRHNDTLQVYFDTEKNDYRCYKKANLCV